MKDCIGPWDNMEGKLRDLSGVCSALWHTREYEDHLYDDIQAFHAPSECMALGLCAIERKRIDIIHEWCWDPEALVNELRHRLSYRWLYFSGMLNLIPVTQQRRHS